MHPGDGELTCTLVNIDLLLYLAVRIVHNYLWLHVVVYYTSEYP